MPPVRRLAACALVLSVALPAAAQDVYVIDGAHTTPMFEIAHNGGMSRQRGFFTNTAGRITLDRAAKTGSIDVVIGTGSIVTGSRVLTDVLKRDDFFASDRYPTMRFTSREVAFDGDVPVAFRGELTLLDVTRPVTLAIADFRCGTQPFTRRPMCGAEATATIRRSDFGMTYGVPNVAGDDVRIVIPVEAVRE